MSFDRKAYMKAYMPIYNKTYKRAKKYYEKNPYIRLLHNAKNRARKKNIEFSITLDDLNINQEFCPILGIPRDTNDQPRGLSAADEPCSEGVINNPPEVLYFSKTSIVF